MNASLLLFLGFSLHSDRTILSRSVEHISCLSMHFLVHLDYDTSEIKVQQQFLNDLTCRHFYSELGTTHSCLPQSKIELYQIGMCSYYLE